MTPENTPQQTPEGKPRPARRRKALAWGVVIVVLALLSLPLLHRQKRPAEGPERPGGGSGVTVNVATVSKGSLPMEVDALGTVTAEHTVNVYSQVSGRITAVHYQEGQLVRKGQPLVDIDPRQVQAQLQQATGTLMRDRAILDQAKANLQRYQTALQRNAIAQQTASDQEATVRQYEGTVMNDQATVDYYKVQLEYCHITAPISGRIGLRLVDPGNTVFTGSSSTIAVITQVDPITVVFALPEDRIQAVQNRLRAKGQTLQVELFDRSGSNRLAAGRLLGLDSAVDTTTGTLKMRATFDNRDGKLFPNQFVNTRMELSRLEGALLVPTVAVQYNGQQAFIYRMKADHTAELVKVNVIHTAQGHTALEGLNEGDQVVTSNFDRIQEGAALTVAGQGSHRK
nr:efflux RND transporter periplasmic adaptor subunit [uncultured Holophaga sp.]